MPRPRMLAYFVAIFLATLAAYWPAVHAGFIWNDADYVTAPALRSLPGLARIWFEVGATEQYYPFLHSAFWLQHRLWGDAPAGYHLLNILLHAGSACWLVALLRRLAMPGAILAGFLFALHPVYVESVAWISEEKNTLSLFFYLLAALTYLRFEESRRPRAYLVATGLFVLALLSKSTTATLPPALLVVAWWRRGALNGRRDVVPLLPWFALAAGMGLVSAYVERNYIGAEGADFALDSLQRVLLAGRITWFYFGKLFWPGNLIFIYPRWEVGAGHAIYWLCLVGLVAALAGLWRLRRHSRAPLAAALFFGGSLFPVLGFFNVYAFIYSYVADHWQYLPSLGIVVLAAAGVSRFVAGVAAPAAVGTLRLSNGARPMAEAGRGSPGSGAMRALPILLVAALGVLTFHQSRMYADMRTFYRTTLERNPAAWMAHNNLGNLLREDQRLEAAIAHFEAALRVKPDLAKVHNNLATCLRDLKRMPGAIEHYRRAIEIVPDYPEAHNNLGSLLRQLGQTGEALAHLSRAVQLDPEYLDARNNFGMALRDAGRMKEALAQFQQIIRVSPNSSPAHLNLSLTLSLLGRDTEAMEHYREARRLNPAIPELSAR